MYNRHFYPSTPHILSDSKHILVYGAKIWRAISQFVGQKGFKVDMNHNNGPAISKIGS